MRGPNNPRWRGGTWVDSRGYVNVYAPDHPTNHCRNYSRRHRFNFYEYHGDTPENLPDREGFEHSAPFGWDIHHHDANKMNDAPSNLEPSPAGMHQRKGHKANGGTHGQYIPLYKGDPRAVELGRKGGRKTAQNKKKSTRSHGCQKENPRQVGVRRAKA